MVGRSKMNVGWPTGITRVSRGEGMTLAGSQLRQLSEELRNRAAKGHWLAFIWELENRFL